MDFGLTGKLGAYYLTRQYQKNRAAGKSDSVSFAELAAAKAAGTEGGHCTSRFGGEDAK